MSANISPTLRRAPRASNQRLADSIWWKVIVLLLWVFVVFGASGFVHFLQRNDRAKREDFAVYYLEAQELRHNVNPYATNFALTAHSSGLNTHAIAHGSDPPTFLVFLIEPLTLLPIWTAYWVWQAANLACLIAALILLIGPGSGLVSSFAFSLAVLAVLYPPIVSHFWFGQSKFPLLLLLVLMMRRMEKKRDVLAGTALAVAILLRIFPLVMAGYLVLQQRWRALTFAIVGLVIGGGFTVALAGLHNCTSFFVSAIGLVNDSAAGIYRDIGLYFFVSRNIAGISHYLGLRFDLVRNILTYACDIVLLATTARATVMLPAGEDPDSRMFSLWVATSVLLLPVAWDYDLSLMLIPFARLAVVASRGEASRRAITMAVVSYVTLIWWEFVAHSANEGGFFAMLTAYLAAYWLATDQPQCTAFPILSLPTRIWRRVTPFRWATE